MSQQYLASDEQAPHWEYIRTGPGRSGRSLSENNFAKERRDWLSILLREILQNALDARDVTSSVESPVVVSLRLQTLDPSGQAFVKALFPDEHLNRFRESVPHADPGKSPQVTSCLIVEDFGTSGLTGAFDEPELDGEGQNWNGFWFREGEGGKEMASGNGGAGQGKITYFSTSGLRTIFTYTVRSTDKREALFGASSFLRDYNHDGHKWKRDAYWGLSRGSGDDRIYLPSQAPEPIDSFRRHFGLKRTATQTGLSLIVPAPKEISLVDAVQITIAEFFVPIARGDLVVEIGDTTLDKSSIVALANDRLTDDKARELHTCTTRGFREFLLEAIERTNSNQVVLAKPFTEANKLTEASFEPSALLSMRESLEQQKVVSVRFPVTVRSKSATTPPIECCFDVHLVYPFDLDQPEQAVIRRDLLIGEEPVGAGKLRVRARGLTLISDATLSRLLLTAEEATHLRWNTRLPRLNEYYKSGPVAVAIVRNSMVKLLDILTGGDKERDFKLLAKYFSAPGSSPAVQSKGRKSPKGKQQPIPGEIPPPKPKLIAIDDLVDGCRVRPAKAGALVAANLPLHVSIEFAYEGLDKDAFNEYDPLDFDLQEKSFAVETIGCTVLHKALNHISFSVDDPDFDFKLTGFDKNLRLRMRVNYQEAPDAATFDAQ